MKILTGKVISKKMKKTAVVAVERVIVHPIYKKRLKRIKKYHVHDTLDTKVEEIVDFVASKPFSKTKKWKIIKRKIDAQSRKVLKKGKLKPKNLKQK